ncbi:exodeoxyribonuclease VII large subunit [Acaricomes phytoseiuli]|uniref:exodeoxyribonuclease VII large subunit n=1 Tax=Acaricomes phytoseiuli TaxID=291968 RepID=UPI0003789AD7|nr:exodeoxyribonuclease VII large subunit [Acaricomes phytoseiuli]
MNDTDQPHAEDSASATTPGTAAETSPDRPWPLRMLSEKLKAHIEKAPAAWVEGQIIELNRRANVSYLTLRDVDAEVSLNVTLFASVLNNLDAPLEKGARVVAQLKPDFWLKTGRLSMQGRQIRTVGIGDLLVRIEALRQALGAEGLFAPERKQALPLLPQKIGLITGRNSDAMKDVLRNAGLRWPAVRFEIREVAVQGVNSVAQVRAALEELDADPEVDVIVIARGGGSLEDLLGFSNESLVRAVAAASTPVVSAIGHEADRPLLDEVADLRASTPTDAAKRIVPDVAEELRLMAQARFQLDRAVQNLLRHERERLENIRSRPALAEPDGMILVRARELQTLRLRSFTAASGQAVRHRDQLEHLRARVLALSPQKTLDRGYAVVQQDDGRIVRSAEEAPDGTPLRIRLASGQLAAASQGPLPGTGPDPSLKGNR